MRDQTLFLLAQTETSHTIFSSLSVKKVIPAMSTVCFTQCANYKWLKFIPTYTTGVICEI